ncbi:MAG: protein kinase [Anaerolineae bacterium]
MANETVLNGRYRLVAQQGSGGMAVIYKAVDQALGRTVAIKILRPSLTNDPAFLARFRNEARSVANLAHPNIVTVHDVGSDGPTHYIVMEFVEGTDLKRIIKADGALPIDRAINLAIQICGGIGFAHRAGLVHADVKPQNILVTKDDVVKVTDFGIAQALSDAQPGEKQQVVWGSPHYFAPEQARGEKPTPASDVYSIGIVIFEMLTGRLPYTGANQQELALAHIRERIPTVIEFNPNVPESLSRIVYKTMSKEPPSRYRMADQLGHILVGYRDRGRDEMTQQPRMPPTLPTVTSVPESQIPPPPASPQWQTWQPGTAGRVPPRASSRSRPSAMISPRMRLAFAGRTAAVAARGAAAYRWRQLQPVAHAVPAAPHASGCAVAGHRDDHAGDLAFLAVACLIPLRTVVFQARF